MTELNREMIETLVRQIVTEKLMPTKQVDQVELCPSNYRNRRNRRRPLRYRQPSGHCLHKRSVFFRKPAPWLRFNGDERYHLRLDTRIR